MGKKKNEVNGVLVYRRWCVGAILSTIILLLVIAAVGGSLVFRWFSVTVPDASVSASFAGERVWMSGLDLFAPVLGKFLPFLGGTALPIQELIVDIGGATSIKYFVLIMTIINYAMFGLLAVITLFGVIEVIFFIFYLLTGRVVSPAAPMKLSWVIFVLIALYAGATYGITFFLGKAYLAAGGAEPLKFNFWFPIIYTGVALVAAILLSIVYVAAFKDKYFIGRAKRFGGGDTTTERYETTRIITPGVTTSGTQPQVIVVNTTPPATSGPIIATIPGQSPQPVVQVIPQQQPQQPVSGAQPEPVANATLPSDLKSIGGHAYSKNLDLKYADIPSGIKELGAGAFANCLNLEVVSIPKSVKRIKKNCFFNCAKLTRINYAGTKAEWRYVVRGSNWLEKAGTKTIVCADGAIIVDPHR